MKLAFADAYALRRAIPTSMTGHAARRCSIRAYLAQRARLIDANARAAISVPATPPRGGTVYLAPAMQSGMMVSLIQSNYMGFGSGVVVPGTGISLQNRGAGFSLEPGHPNEVGRRQASVPHDHPGLRDARRRAARRVRRDGRSDPAARATCRRSCASSTTG